MEIYGPYDTNSREQITINRYRKTFTMSSAGKKDKPPEPKVRGEPVKRRRKIWYNKKSPQSLNKIITLINYLYEHRKTYAVLRWVTITTLQHQTGATDKHIMYQFKKWIQHKNLDYICVCERQRNTGDLHLHLIIATDNKFDFAVEVNRWADLLGVKQNPNLFDSRTIYDAAALSLYISKYIRKSCPPMAVIERMAAKYGDKYKPHYSSLFECRTFSCSARINSEVKGDTHKFQISIPVAYHRFLKHGGPARFDDFCSRFSYSDDAFNDALNLYRMLRRGGLVD